MITREQLKRVDEIRLEIERVNKTLRGLDSPYVQTVVGLVDVNKADPCRPVKSESCEVFHNYYP